jgi:hypothetical protein
MIALTSIVIGFLIAVALYLATRPGANLGAEYAQSLNAQKQQSTTQAAAPLTQDAIAALPAPVQRYLQRSGTLGKPPLRSFYAVFDAEMFQKPGDKGMPGPVEQFNRVQDPWRRLFFMTTRMSGLPVAVLHDYSGTDASMRVRLARLFDLVNIRSAELARTETVTLLNDLCFFAPSALLGPAFAWTAVDEHQVDVRFTNGPHSVRARLLFDANGDLVNFVSDDRGALQPDGTMKLMRWSTPMREYREFAGRRVPTAGDAIWHRPEGDFVYGRMRLRSIEFDKRRRPPTPTEGQQ